MARDESPAQRDQPTAAERRRALLREQMREEILSAAREILQEQGASALTMRGVAGRIGYSTGAIYEYFSSKDDLCIALFFQGSEGLAGRMREALSEVPEGAPTLEYIRATGTAYRKFANEYRDLYLLIFSQAAGDDGATTIENLRDDQAFSGLIQLVSAGVERGELREMDPLEGALLLWTWIHGFVMLELTGHIPNDPPDLPERLFEGSRKLVAGSLLPAGQSIDTDTE